MKNSEKKFFFGISKNVFVMGLVSFFNDIASEMIYPIVPIFLTSFLGAPVVLVGLIEGIAEATASILKVVFGWVSDKTQQRKPFIIAGYGFSTFSKIVLGFAFSWPMVLLGRFIDKFGKGARTSPRDALISESSKETEKGKAFGFHRALDTVGAVIGPLSAIGLLKILNNNYKLIFLLASIPAMIGVLLLLLFVKEQKQKLIKNGISEIKWGDFTRPFKIFLFISILFALGNSSDAFLILRSQNLGLSVTATIFAYVLYNTTYALFSTPAGIISDRIGSKKVMVSGFLLFALVYALFGLIQQSFLLWILFPVYGIYMALTDGVSKAYISNLVPKEKLGTFFGIYQTIIGLCTFFASFLAGVLWSNVGVSAPFIFGGCMAALSAIFFMAFPKKSANEV